VTPAGNTISVKMPFFVETSTFAIGVVSVTHWQVHYLFHCAAYAAPRAVLMGSLRNHLPINIINNERILEGYLIFGSRDIEFTVNLTIFSEVFTFIDATGRFA
jgi:hypothetical protein